MSNKKQKLLSIAIPTWNRCEFLRQCIFSIFNQIDDDIRNDLELIVCDNASTDKTINVISEFKRKGLDLKLYKSKKNLGSDQNFANCYTKSNGLFVYMIADDDILMPNTLKNIFSILRKNSKTGVIFLSPFGFDKNPFYEKPFSFNSNKLYINPNEFLKKIGIKVTLISTLVINKKINGDFDPFLYCGSELIQVHLALNAITKSKLNIFVSNYSVGILRNNGGNNVLPSQSDSGMRSYNPTYVFGVKLPEVFSKYQKNGINVNTIKYIKKNILFYYLPKYIFTQMIQKSPYFDQSYKLMEKNYKNIFLFQIFFKPIFKLIYPLNYIFCFILICFGRILFERNSILLKKLLSFKLSIK